MTAKEALKIIKPKYTLLLPSTMKKDLACEVIEKELEILELFKKYLNVRNIDLDTIVVLGLELYLNEMPKEEVELLKEWLKDNYGHDLDREKVDETDN